MNYFVFTLQSALKDFFRNKTRTLLTSLGILIGILSVILLIAIGVGLQNFITQQFDDLGANSIYVLPGQVFNEEGGFQSSAGEGTVGLSFDEEDYIRLRRIREIRTIAPIQSSSGSLTYAENEVFGTIMYSTEDIFAAQNLQIEDGRIFSEEDVQKRSKVVVIGSSIAEKLFISNSLAIDKRVNLNGFSFTVIGVLKEKGGGGFGGPDFDSMVYVPFRTGTIITGSKEISNFIIRPRSDELIPIVKEKIETELLKKYEEDEFSLAEQTEILETITSIFNTVNIALVGIAAISLLVGGIGIMNIMYVTVTERIKEIGIRRAIGARKRDILSQFLMESVLLSLFGGVLALIFAYVIVFIVQDFFPAEITIEAVILSLGVSSGIGILFGVFPAKKAADLSPIDAIRYE